MPGKKPLKIRVCPKCGSHSLKCCLICDCCLACAVKAKKADANEPYCLKCDPRSTAT